MRRHLARVDVALLAPAHEEGVEVVAGERLVRELGDVVSGEGLEGHAAADDIREVVEEVEALRRRRRWRGVAEVMERVAVVPVAGEAARLFIRDAPG
jgi:hypothetical protein